MRLAEGFTRVTPPVMVIVFYTVSFTLNTMVIRVLGWRVTYGVWCGVGTVLTALIGIYHFKEPATAIKMVSMGLIVMGVMGLHSTCHVGPSTVRPMKTVARAPVTAGWADLSPRR
jgi:small multidrug resistance pump